MREFRRSRVFGLVGVFVVAGIAVVIALSADSTTPDPRLQEGLIFGLIAVFVVLLLLVQRGDMNRAATGDSFAPLLIGGPLVAIVAIYGAIRAIGPGGEVDSAYDRMARAMKPLGLSVSERPTVRMVPRYPTMPGYSAKLFGPTVMTGQRHGRRIDAATRRA